MKNKFKSHSTMNALLLAALLSAMALMSSCGGSSNEPCKESDSSSRKSCGSSGGGTVFGYYTIGENGTSSSPWGDGSSDHRPAMAVKFTPSSYPITITAVTIYAKNNTGLDQMFNLYGFDGNLSSETEIFSHVQHQSIPNTGVFCYPKTINIPATVISSGSFHIAVEWVTKPLDSVSGSNSFFLCTDSTLNHTNTSFFRHTGTAWVSLESISASSGDLGILVNYE